MEVQVQQDGVYKQLLLNPNYHASTLQNGCIEAYNIPHSPRVRPF